MMLTQLCTLKKEWRLTPSATGGVGGIGGSAGGIGSLGGIGAGHGISRQGADGGAQGAQGLAGNVELDDLKKIRKVQGFFRGWLCRHRWKVIVEEYIKSPHAESMRKRNRFLLISFFPLLCFQLYSTTTCACFAHLSRFFSLFVPILTHFSPLLRNPFVRDSPCPHRPPLDHFIQQQQTNTTLAISSLVFRMLEDEEENVQQLEILVARFYRPFKMAASSKK